MTNMQGSSRQLFCTPAFIAVTATVLRLAGLGLLSRFRPWLMVGPSTGGEVIQIAVVLAGVVDNRG
jgi:hypothetical protein